MDRCSGFGDDRVKLRCRKHIHGSESGLFLELSARLWYLLCYPKRHKHSCNFFVCEVNKGYSIGISSGWVSFGDDRVKFRCRKHIHGSESGLFLELSARLWYLLVLI